MVYIDVARSQLNVMRNLDLITQSLMTWQGLTNSNPK